MVAVAVAGTLKEGWIRTATRAWLSDERDGRDPADLDAAEDDGGARVQPLAGPGEGALELVVAGEVAVGQADQRDGAEDEPAQDDEADHEAQEPLHPTNRAVALTPPKRISDMKRLTTTTRMMERRMARPAATPTPAGPPVAL